VEREAGSAAARAETTTPEAAAGPARSTTALEAVLAELVVDRTLVLVGEDLVGFADLLELLLSSGLWVSAMGK
jgi:hypothetical protein